MTEAFWNGIFDTRWEDSPLGAEALRMVRRLRGRRYSERTCRDYGQMVIHLGRVLDAQGGVDTRRLDESTVTDFVERHLPVCTCYRQGASRRKYWHAKFALVHLLEMLREEGGIPPVVPVQAPYQQLLDDYVRFLRKDRGLAEGTVIIHRRYVTDFLATRAGAVSPGELVGLTAETLLSFSRQRGGALGPSCWNQLAMSVSHFYRWLEFRGDGGGHLVGAVPQRRRYRLADVPCALAWEQVQRLLEAVDRRGRDGRRNYAMLLLIATYGLRGCEVRALRIENIDWSHDELAIFSPKSGRSRRLPLTRPVGEAILDYLQHERPVSSHREVFLSSWPPQGPIRHKFYGWVARCFERAGIKSAHRGAHTLRHSVALHLLRSGVTLKGIGDVLGHQCAESTLIYTKLHVDDLRTVALDPEVIS